MVCVVG